MTNILQHIEYVTDNPFELTAALALADRMQEEWGVSRFTALRGVAKLRWPARQAHYINHAAAVMRRHSRSALLAHDRCILACTLSGNADVTLVFLSGFRSPECTDHSQPPGATGFSRRVVSVGAREFIRVHKHYLKEVRQISAKYRFPGSKKKAGAK